MPNPDGGAPPYRSTASPPAFDVPPELLLRVERELEPGEVLRWVAQPVPARAARAGRGLVGFAIPWTAFSLFWMWGVSQGSLLVASCGIPFVLIGLGMLASPLFLARRARRSVYAITDRRVITVLSEGRSGVRIRSFRPGDLGAIERVEHDDGTGDVTLAIDRVPDGDGGKRSERVGLLAVRDPRDVEARVLALRAPPTRVRVDGEPDEAVGERAGPARTRTTTDG